MTITDQDLSLPTLSNLEHVSSRLSAIHAIFSHYNRCTIVVQSFETCLKHSSQHVSYLCSVETALNVWILQTY